MRYFGGSDFDSFVLLSTSGLILTAVYVRGLLEDQILYHTAGLLNALAIYS